MTKALRDYNARSCQEAALAYAERGWAVFPLHHPIETDDKIRCSCGKDPCDNIGKHPRTKNGVADASTDIAKIKDWWTRWPHANVAVRTGITFLVIDVDSKNEGMTSLPEVIAFEPNLKATPTVHTGGGGRHLYAAIPKDAGHVPNRVGLWKGIDVRADGGYVVAPPSLHSTLRRYQWVAEAEEMTVLSESFIQKVKVKDGESVRKDAISNTIIPDGQRNATLFRIAASRASRGLDYEDTLGFVRRVNHERCDPPLDDTEVVRTVESAYTYPPSLEYTDLGNSRGLAHWFGKDIKWTPGLGWLEWTDGKWDAVTDVHMLLYAHQFTGMLTSIAREKSNESLSKWAHIIQSSGRLESMVRQFKPLVETKTERFDGNTMLLPCLNGTLELNGRGRFRNSLRDDWMTRRIPVAFDPKATCPIWESSLKIWLNNDHELIEWLRRVVGYCLTGDRRHQCLFILFGSGANGKSTFTRTLQTLLGEYATTISSELLMLKPRISVETETARLMGTRLAICSETSEGGKISAEVVKDLTGSDVLRGRHLYQRAITFTPTHKIILHTNHKPKASSYDQALWRRIIPVPFTTVIPREQQNTMLSWQLLDELPGILNWAIKGCHEEREEGRDVMTLPLAVAKAKQEYQAENDTILAFLEETVIHTENAFDRISAKDLHTRYIDWCRRGRAGGPMEYKTFNKVLRERPDFKEHELLVHNVATWSRLRYVGANEVSKKPVDLERP